MALSHGDGKIVDSDVSDDNVVKGDVFADEGVVQDPLVLLLLFISLLMLLMFRFSSLRLLLLRRRCKI